MENNFVKSHWYYLPRREQCPLIVIPSVITSEKVGNSKREMCVLGWRDLPFMLQNDSKYKDIRPLMCRTNK